jgi:bifunctional DNA-binding transcriptional regulator/antitoxin component of YhaV-PrlF toxin-antitoxin module
LKDRLIFGNGFSLRKRLRQLASRHAQLKGILGESSHFADDVADMRNMLAHAKGNETPTRSAALRMLVMLHRVKLLFQSELLLQLGFDENFLKSLQNHLVSAEIGSRKVERPIRQPKEVPEERGPIKIFSVELEANGNVNLPLEFREVLGLYPGAKLTAELTDHGLAFVIQSHGQAPTIEDSDSDESTAEKSVQ